MSEARPKPTLMDYMAIAISPSLIILLVGSLAFFLLMVFYAGAFEARLYWTTGCFVFAAVLISRISIEEGAERASLFGIALGAVTALAMTRFTNHPWWAWLVLGIIWWCASHLIWNCTVVDDDDDASGAGLLEAAGFDAALSTATAPPKEAPPLTAAARRKRQKEAAKAAEVASAKPVPPEQPWIKRAFAWWQNSRSRKAPPGLTVVYFSLAALPIFGFGQRFVATDDRLCAFQCLFVYVASALGLLVTTSFLGLRRYLRQRRLEMPIEMAGTWLAAGAALVGIVLILAVLIPRPQPEYAISSLTGMLSSPEREASPYSPMHDSPAQGESSSGAPDEQQKQANDSQPEQQQNDNPSGDSSQSGGQQGQKSAGSGQQADTGQGEDKGESAAGSKGGDSQQSGGSSSGGKSGQPQSGSSSQSQGQQSQGQPPQQSQQNQATQSSGEKQQQHQSNNTPSQQPAGQQQQQQNSTAAENDQQRTDQTQQQQQQSQQQQDAGKESSQQGSQEQTAQQTSKTDNSEQKASEQQDSSEKSKGSQDSMSSKMAQSLGQRWQQGPRLRPPPLTSAGGMLWLLKMLVYAVVAIAVVYGLIRYWAEVRAFLSAAWRELVALWQSIFGGRPATADEATEALAPVRRTRPFASYPDPFTSGAANGKRASAVVQYSFEALEAWAADHDRARLAEETPLEFAARLAGAHPPLAAGAQELASLYARVAYARDPLQGENLAGLRQLWIALQRAAATVTSR